jgi:hypothetical protein
MQIQRLTLHNKTGNIVAAGNIEAIKAAIRLIFGPDNHFTVGKEKFEEERL